MGIVELNNIIKLKNMNAKEARDVADQHNLMATTTQYNNIKLMIEKESKAGVYSVTTSTPLLAPVHNMLKAEGFEVEENFNQIDGTTVIISW